jgi:hypothetical protein
VQLLWPGHGASGGLAITQSGLVAKVRGFCTANNAQRI